MRVEFSQGAFQPEICQNRWCTVTRTNNIKHVQIMLLDQEVEMCVDQGQSGTCSPVAQQPGFDIVESQISLKEDIVLQKDHSSSNIISCASVFGHSLIGVLSQRLLFELNQQIRDIVGDIRWPRLWIRAIDHFDWHN